MKKILWLLCLFFPQVVGAFFSTEGIERDSLNVMITTKNDQAEVTIITKLVNTSDKELSFDYLYPIGNQATTPKLYLNSTGRSIELLEDQKKLELIARKAQTHKDYRFFRLHRPHEDRLLWASGIVLPAKKSVTLKLKYSFGLDFLDDIFFKEIFLNDEILTQNFELNLILDRPQKIKYFLPVYEKVGKILNRGDQIVWHIVEKNFIPKDNFRFFFSEVDSPVLTYKAREGTYFAHFFDVDTPLEYKKIQIIVDQSGSVYKKPWEKQQEILSIFLDQLSTDKKIKTQFFDDEIFELDKDFEPNSRARQKKLIEYFDEEDPLGKSNFTNIFTIIEGATDDTMLLFLGDFEGINIPKEKWGNLLPHPIVFLDFATKNEALRTWVEAQGGKYLHIFNDPEFVKSNSFQALLSAIIKPLKAEDIASKFPKEQDFLPREYRRIQPYYANFFVSRSFEENNKLNCEAGECPLGGKVSNNLANFLPRIWGQRKLANLLQEKEVSGVLSKEKQNAIASIGHFFGIDTDLIFSPEVLGDFQKYYQKISSLEDFLASRLNEKIRFVRDWPLYQSKQNGLERFGFFDTANKQNIIEFAPFSEAEKAIFLAYPDLTAPFFGLGSQVNFCYRDWRCLSVLKDKRKEAKVSDLFFWGGHHLDHWANVYLKKLADKGVLNVDKEGNAQPNQKITRGEFVQMAVEYKYGKDFERVNPPEKPLQDLDVNLYLTEVVNFLIDRGIIQGYQDQTFRPHRNLSRAEAVKILLSMQDLKIPEDYVVSESVFPDINGWENFWVVMAKSRGMVKGYGDGKFWPHRTLTRAEAAKLIVESGK